MKFGEIWTDQRDGEVRFIIRQLGEANGSPTIIGLSLYFMASPMVDHYPSTYIMLKGNWTKEEDLDDE